MTKSGVLGNIFSLPKFFAGVTELLALFFPYLVGNDPLPRSVSVHRPCGIVESVCWLLFLAAQYLFEHLSWERGRSYLVMRPGCGAAVVARADPHRVVRSLRKLTSRGYLGWYQACYPVFTHCSEVVTVFGFRFL